MASALRPYRPPANRAIAAIQNARNGISDSSELPLTTNAGVARNNSAAHSACGENRLASDHIASAAISENEM